MFACFHQFKNIKSKLVFPSLLHIIFVITVLLSSNVFNIVSIKFCYNFSLFFLHSGKFQLVAFLLKKLSVIGYVWVWDNFIFYFKYVIYPNKTPSWSLNRVHDYHIVKVCPGQQTKWAPCALLRCLTLKQNLVAKAGCGSSQILCPRKDIVKVEQNLPFYNQVKPVPVGSAKINCSWNTRCPSPNNGLSKEISDRDILFWAWKPLNQGSTLSTTQN